MCNLPTRSRNHEEALQVYERQGGNICLCTVKICCIFIFLIEMRRKIKVNLTNQLNFVKKQSAVAKSAVSFFSLCSHYVVKKEPCYHIRLLTVILIKKIY
jgi:hypothetical protein